MGWNFRKSIKFGPVRLNLSKSGVGASIGVRGYRKGVNAKGQKYTHTSIPGAGIYNRSYEKKISLDDGDLNPNEFKKLNGTGLFVCAIIFVAFVFIWMAGESFWFAFILCAIATILSGSISSDRLYDIHSRSEGDVLSREDETGVLEEELARLEALENSRDESPFSIFGLDENCSRKDLNREFKNKIKLYHPDKLEHLGPELQVLGQQKSTEIIEAYEKCSKIIQQKKSA